MGEVQFIGQITSASEFSKTNFLIKWNIQIGNGWKLLSGEIEGQTSISKSNYNKNCYWGFPIDVHFTTKTIQGWPKLNLHVYHIDNFNRMHLQGYGHLFFPTTPGQHTLTCYVWRPTGNLTQKITQFFIGGSLQLSQTDKINSTVDRCNLNTESMGTIALDIGVIFRYFKDFGVEYS